MPEFYMILSRKIIKKKPNFYDICPKNLQNSRILHDFCPKMHDFYVIIARKIFFPEF